MGNHFLPIAGIYLKMYDINIADGCKQNSLYMRTVLVEHIEANNTEPIDNGFYLFYCFLSTLLVHLHCISALSTAYCSFKNNPGLISHLCQIRVLPIGESLGDL